ncbi:F-box-like [Rhizoctonia solani]|uniref:F-box-like n=1 Tax=Rhizoctonia solani TaxID=456999 RepID=A0A8H7IGX8_9AGAM|nr:F-box-like [Rhizoctonia solani]
MFLREFSRSRLRGSRGFATQPNREIKPLPSRAQAHGEGQNSDDYLPENFVDWRWMFRVSSNWSRGRCTATVQRGSLALRWNTACWHRPENPIAASLSTLTTQTLPMLARASIYVFCDAINSGLRIRYEPAFNEQVFVTSLCLDHSSANIRLAIFYSDHTWAIHTVDYERRCSTTDFTSSRSRDLVSNTTIVKAVFHHPLLITLSSSFRMCIYYLPTPPAPPVLKHTLSSYSGFAPLTMTLARYRTPDQYRVLLAHASPIYPAHWGPSATDIMISIQSILNPSQSNALSPMTPGVRILSSSSTNSQLPVGWIPDGSPDGIPEELRLRWLRKVSYVSGIQTDGRFVVFASDDGGIQRWWPLGMDLESGVGIRAIATHSSQVFDELEANSTGSDREEAPFTPSGPHTIVRIAFDAHKIVVVDDNDILYTYNFDT